MIFAIRLERSRSRAQFQRDRTRLLGINQEDSRSSFRVSKKVDWRRSRKVVPELIA